MRVINQGEKADIDGVILNMSEYDNYIKLLEALQVFKAQKKEYDECFGGV